MKRILDYTNIDSNKRLKFDGTITTTNEETMRLCDSHNDLLAKFDTYYWPRIEQNFRTDISNWYPPKHDIFTYLIVSICADEDPIGQLPGLAELVTNRLIKILKIKEIEIIYHHINEKKSGMSFVVK